MEFGEVVRRRRMVRDYDADRPVPPDILERVLAHAIRAPSAGFAQGWGFLVLSSADERDRFWAATTPASVTRTAWLSGMRHAPVVIVPHSNKATYLARYAEPDKGWTDQAEDRWPVPYWDIDAGMASLLMLLTAVDEGLGACFFGIPPEQIAGFKTAFSVPADFHPIGAITLGYRAPDRRSPSLARGRRSVAEVVHYGTW